MSSTAIDQHDAVNSTPKLMKIMIVGDSISHGHEGDWTWRYRIWQWFRRECVPAAFVGPYWGTVPPEKPPEGPPRLRPPPLEHGPGITKELEESQPETETAVVAVVEGGYARGVSPDFLLSDQSGCNHFSVWGRQARQAKELVAEQVAKYQPDMLLIELGFNDIAWWVGGPVETLANVKELIDEARAAVRGNVKFAVANVPNRTSIPGREDLVMNTKIYNIMLETAIPSWSTPESPVALVRFCEEYSCGGNNSDAAYDGLHPNALGEYQIAKAFSQTLVRDFNIGRMPLAVPGEIPQRPSPTPTHVRARATPWGVTVTWEPVYGAFGYEIRCRCASSGASLDPDRWSEFHRTGCNRHDTMRCLEGQRWEYQVRASCGDGELFKSPWSDAVSAFAHPRTAPGPRNIITHAVPEQDAIRISWEPPGSGFDAEIDRYGVMILDRDIPGAFPHTVGVKGNGAIIRRGLTKGHHYGIAVETWTTSGVGLPSGARAVTVGMGVPSIPDEVQACIINNTTAELSWKSDATAAGYRIWVRKLDKWQLNVDQKDSEQSVLDFDPSASSSPREIQLLIGLRPSVQEYEFAVCAYNGNDESGWSRWTDARRSELDTKPQERENTETSVADGDVIRIRMQMITSVE